MKAKNNESYRTKDFLMFVRTDPIPRFITAIFILIPSFYQISFMIDNDLSFTWANTLFLFFYDYLVLDFFLQSDASLVKSCTCYEVSKNPGMLKESEKYKLIFFEILLVFILVGSILLLTCNVQKSPYRGFITLAPIMQLVFFFIYNSRLALISRLIKENKEKDYRWPQIIRDVNLTYRQFQNEVLKDYNSIGYDDDFGNYYKDIKDEIKAIPHIELYGPKVVEYLTITVYSNLIDYRLSVAQALKDYEVQMEFSKKKEAANNNAPSNKETKNE